MKSVGRPDRRAAARWRAALGALGPLGVALLLPGPRSQVALLHDTRPDVVIGAASVLAATAVVWALVGWAALMVCSVIASRLPGAAGRLGGRVLLAVTPSALRHVVAAAAGLSLAAGIGACGAGAGGPSPIIAAVTATTSADGGAELPTAARHADVLVDLDWPLGPQPVREMDATAGAAAKGVGSAAVVPPIDPGRTVQDPAEDASAAIDADGTTVDVDTSGPTADAAVGSVVEPAASSSVVVRRGDSLWVIAAAHLPEGASPSEIDTSWRQWYAANRSVIGPDPNLVLPGERLWPPAAGDVR